MTCSDYARSAPYSAPGDSLRSATPAIALWDYKTGTCPQKGTLELRSYEQQMRLYAFLYRRCYHQTPAETALYFLRELVRKTPPPTRPPKALYQVPITSFDDDDVLEWLGDILSQEIKCSEQNCWPPPPPGGVPYQTCRNCGFQQSCSSFQQPFLWERDGNLEEVPDPPDW